MGRIASTSLRSRPFGSVQRFSFNVLCLLLIFCGAAGAQAPDLVVKAGAVLDAATVGVEETINVTYQIKNVGDGAAQAPYRDSIYLSADEVLDPGDTFLRQSYLHSATGAGVTTSLHTRELTIPYGAALGAAYVIVHADGDDLNAESDETNNTLALPVEVVAGSGLPDLVVKDDLVIVDLAQVGTGENVVISFKIKNQGAATSDVDFRDTVYLSADTAVDAGDLFLTDSTLHNVPLGPGNNTGQQDRQVTIALDQAPGDYFVLVVADGYNEVAESDETNNVSITPLTIAESTKLPDFVIKDGIVTLSRADVTRGGLLVVDYQVQNAGERINDGEFRDTIFLSTDTVIDADDILLRKSIRHTVPVEAGGATEHADREVTIPMNVQPGNYFVVVKADGDAQVVESDEANNEVAVPLPVLPFSVAITSPAPGLVTQADFVNVSGAISETVVAVEVNGMIAALAGETGVAETYSAANVPLREGTNKIVVTARGEDDQIVTRTVSVRRDTDPPIIVIESPAANEQTTADTVTVAGTVNDIIPGATVNEDDVSVTVNGIPALLTNRTFMLADVDLDLGVNVIDAVATDAGGNTRATSITVIREEDLSGIHFEILSGNNQRGQIGETLPGAFIVQVFDADDNPMAGRPIDFVVSNGDGLVGDPADGEREFTVLSDANGLAQVTFTLGNRTGEGLHRVRASTAGSLSVAELCATAEPLPAENIAQVREIPIRGVADSELSESFSVVVTDSGGNAVAGVPVTFNVEFGEGGFGAVSSEGSIDPTLVVPTNPDGIADATLTLGPFVGPNANQVTATFPNNPNEPLTFTIGGIALGTGSTSVSGVVQDSVGDPIAGARVFLEETPFEGVTDATGTFKIDNVNPGGYHLAVLGSTANDPANGLTFPDLRYAVEVLAGVDNPMSTPVTLPKLDDSSGKVVGGDTDVTLEMEGVPGFAVTVFANSVILPNGNRGTIRMTSSQVKFDKVPMEPPMGSTPRVVGTLQPAGIVFDPPARVSYPNTNAMEPGEVADIFAFHHDIGQFVNVGPATVSEDASVVVSDPGFGIVKSGWHGTIRRPGPRSRAANGCAAYLFGFKRNTDNFSVPRSSNQPPLQMCVPDDADLTVGFFPRGGSFDSWTSWTSSDTNVVAVNTQQSGVRRQDLTDVNFSALAEGQAELTSPIYRVPVSGYPDITCELKTCVDTTCGEGSLCVEQPALTVNPNKLYRKNGALNLHQGCVVMVGNRRATVGLDGKFVADDIPTIFVARGSGGRLPELAKARATCPDGLGGSITGQSGFFPLNPSSTAVVGDVFPSALDPIPERISVTATATELNNGESAQLTVTAHYTDGSTRDVTSRAEGTTYFTTASRSLDVDDYGLATGRNLSRYDRRVFVVVANQGNTALFDMKAIAPPGDRDSDGMPDIFEDLHGLDKYSRYDANQDLDGDGLSNLEEYRRGTLPGNADTDGDGLPDAIDGDPIRPLNPQAEKAKLIAPGGGAQDYLGSSVAFSGDRLAGGAPENDTAGPSAGAVYVYLNDPVANTWALEAQVTAGDAAQGDNFGTAIALDGDRLAVGATGKDAMGTNSGAVYLFERDAASGLWQQAAMLTPDDGFRNDQFGSAVSLSGDVLLVGAPGYDGAANASGAAYVFERDTTTGAWDQTARLETFDAAARDLFGAHLAVEGTRAVVTAWGDDNDAGRDAGAAYVFEKVNGFWWQVTKLTADDGGFGAAFGSSVGLSGDVVLIGAMFDSSTEAGMGAGYVFERDFAGLWSQTAKLTGSDADELFLLGSSVALAGDTAVVAGTGGVHNDGVTDIEGGIAYVFRRNPDGTWLEMSKLFASAPAAGDEIGVAAAARADGAVALGAARDDSNGTDGGALYVY